MRSTEESRAVSSPAGERLRRAKLFIAGEWADGADTFEVTDKFTGRVIGHADSASEAQVAAAVAAASRSFESTRLDPHERFRILSRVADLVDTHRTELARTIVSESGIPIADASNEVSRTAETFRLSAEEAKRIAGEMVPIDGAPGQAHRLAFTIRVPRGVVCGITSFNSPLNQVAHKVAPALASGNTIVVKPSRATPLSAARLFELLLEAGLPPGRASLVQGPGTDVGRWLTERPEIRFFTFTGSTRVGRWLRGHVGLRPVALELGSIAGTIVCADADLERAAARVASSGFRRAGQVCTSTQRLFVQLPVFDRFCELLVSTVERMPVGDPGDPETMIGPMISEVEAARAEAWVREALDGGARCLTGGTRSGALMRPTVLVDARSDMRVVCEEIFAPVVTIIPFSSLDDAIEQFNGTPYGLAAGIFTRDINAALTAARRLDVGIVHINESSSGRVDLMPFGGVKDSGMGREGPRYAIREMTEERLITISLPEGRT